MGLSEAGSSARWNLKPEGSAAESVGRENEAGCELNIRRSRLESAKAIPEIESDRNAPKGLNLTQSRRPAFPPIEQ